MIRGERIERVESWIGKQPKGKVFCSYDIAKDLQKNGDKKELYRWLMAVKNALRKLEAEGKIKYVGEEQGKAPVKKKLYMKL